MIDVVDAVFAALADPSRRRIAEMLSDGEKTLTELASPLNMTMAGVMKHIGIMEKAGVLATEKRGRTRYCQLVPNRFSEAQAWLTNATRMWTDSLTALDGFLKENP